MEQENYGYVYKITNKLNGKIYIGLRSSSCFDESYWGSGVHISRAIQKHGVENFTREILEWCKSKEDLNQREIYWIAELNSQDPTIGYNITSGGEGGNTYQYLTAEQMSQLRHKLSMNNRDADTIQRWKDNLKAANSGEKNPMYGKYHSDNARKKMSVAKKGKYIPWNKGKHMSEESKRKLSETQKRRLAALKNFRQL